MGRERQGSSDRVRVRVRKRKRKRKRERDRGENVSGHQLAVHALLNLEGVNSQSA